MTTQRTHRPGYCFPNLLEAFFIVVVLFFVEYVTDALIGRPGVDAGLTRTAVASIGRVLAWGLGFAVMLSRNGLTYRELVEGDRVAWTSALGLFLVPVLLMTPGLFAVESVLHLATVQLFPLSDAQREAGYAFTTIGLSALVLVCVIAPIVEELLFRGIILRSFLKQYDPSRAIVYSALVFGFAHLNVYQFVVAFVIGIVIGKLYERTRSLLPGMLLHAGYNTAVMLMVFQCGPDAQSACGDSGLPLKWYPAALASGALGAWLVLKLLGIKTLAQWRPQVRR